MSPGTKRKRNPEPSPSHGIRRPQLGEDALADIIADLGYVCDRQGFDFLAVVATVVGHWHVERHDPGSIDHLPHVDIAVTSSLAMRRRR